MVFGREDGCERRNANEESERGSVQLKREALNLDEMG